MRTKPFTEYMREQKVAGHADKAKPRKLTDTEHKQIVDKNADGAKRKAVDLWNAIAKHEQGGGAREGAASARAQDLARQALGLAQWRFKHVPQTLWNAVVGELRRETQSKLSLPWWWCLEIAHQLLWLMDINYMIDGLPVINIGRAGNWGRHPTITSTHGETRSHHIRGITEQRLRELKEKGQCEFTSRVDLMRFVDDLPELRLHLEPVPHRTRIIRRLSVDARARIAFA